MGRIPVAIAPLVRFASIAEINNQVLDAIHVRA
jgi:hypothetical protein